MKTKANIASPLLASMTREELRSVARVLGVPRGKNTKDTIANLTQAVADGKAQVKMVGYITTPVTPEQPFRKTLFVKKLRTYKDDKVLVSVPDPIPDPAQS